MSSTGRVKKPVSKGGKPVTSGSKTVTARQFSKSDHAAAKTGTTKPVGKAVLACQAKKNTKVKPCDLTELTLTELPLTSTTTHRKENERVALVPEKVLHRAISLFGTAADAPRRPVLQVVGDRPGVPDATKIEVGVTPFATCGPQHVAVAVYHLDENTDHISTAADSFQFTASRQQSDRFEGNFFERYITWFVEPSVYIVAATCCGVRLGEKPNNGGSLQVEVFPADQYAFEFSAPSFKRSRTKTIDRNGTVLKDETETDKDLKHTDDRFRLGGTAAKDHGPSPEEITIKLTRNGQVDDVSADLTKFYDFITDIDNRIKAIEDFIDDSVPQIGYRFESEWSILTGSVSMNWGWKESKDWRVYYSWGATFKLTLLDFSLTLSFGFRMFGFSALVEGTCKGTAVLEADYFFNSPDEPVNPDVGAQIDIPGQLDGRAEAGVGWFSVSFELGVKTGLQGKAILKKGTGFEFHGDLRWCGIKVYRKYKTDPLSAEVEDDWVVMAEKPIWQF